MTTTEHEDYPYQYENELKYLDPSNYKDVIADASITQRHCWMRTLNFKLRKKTSILISMSVWGDRSLMVLVLDTIKSSEIERHTKHLTSVATAAIFALDTLPFLPNSLDWIAFTALFLLACNACYVQGKFNSLCQISDNDI